MAANGIEAPGRSASACSEVQASRLRVPLPLPEVLKNSFKVIDGPPSSSAGNPGLRPQLLFSYYKVWIDEWSACFACAKVPKISVRMGEFSFFLIRQSPLSACVYFFVVDYVFCIWSIMWSNFVYLIYDQICIQIGWEYYCTCMFSIVC